MCEGGVGGECFWLVWEASEAWQFLWSADWPGSLPRPSCRRRRCPCPALTPVLCPPALPTPPYTHRTQDPFGNYVVQYVLELGHPETSGMVMTNLRGHYPELAIQKFSSNVVEKCLKLGGAGLNEQRDAVVAELAASANLGRLLQVWCGVVLCGLVWWWGGYGVLDGGCGARGRGMCGGRSLGGAAARRAHNAPR